MGAKAEFKALKELSEWVKNPYHEDEDGYISPSSSAIGRVEELIFEFRGEEYKRRKIYIEKIYMDGDGGITIKFEAGNKINIDRFGRISC